MKCVAAKARTNSGETRESDTILVQRALEGDADAYSALFQLHKGRVYAVCLRMTNNAADADDLTQEAFILAFRKLATFRGESALSTWLHRVAVNTALMHFRRHPAPHTSLDHPADADCGKHEVAQLDHRLNESLDRIALSRALEALPSGYRTIFELHEIGGYGHREIAKLLRCSVGNSKSQLHKAKQRIRECLVSRRQLARHLERAMKDGLPQAEVLGKYLPQERNCASRAKIAIKPATDSMQPTTDSAPEQNTSASLMMAPTIQDLAGTVA